MFYLRAFLFIFTLSLCGFAHSEEATTSLQEKLQQRANQTPQFRKSSLIFDLPLTYNKRVSYWIEYYQTKGKTWFTDWLEKSSRFMPIVQKELQSVGLPQDLAYMVMIESGFDVNAKSSANAVGPWQFIAPTANRYGLQTTWWLDERRDFKKSTVSAVRYIRDLYKEFGSWYLVAASYNMGEAGLRRQIHKFHTLDFWRLSAIGALPAETMDYVPKILAAMMIAKSPGVYGFHKLTKYEVLDYDLIKAPAGTDIQKLADQIGVTRKYLKEMNAELVTGRVPDFAQQHTIRVPKGSAILASEYLQKSVIR